MPPHQAGGLHMTNRPQLQNPADGFSLLCSASSPPGVIAGRSAKHSCQPTRAASCHPTLLHAVYSSGEPLLLPLEVPCDPPIYELDPQKPPSQGRRFCCCPEFQP